MKAPNFRHLMPFIFLFSLCASAFAQKFPVVPGKSVGQVKLDASRLSVHKLLGKPNKTVQWRSGLLQDKWLGPKPPNNEHGFPDVDQTFLNVIYKKDKVVQIEFNLPNYVTNTGLSIYSTFAQLHAKYKPISKRVLGYDFPDGGGYIAYYYDSVAGGIAFEAITQEGFGEEANPHSIRIHKSGQPVLSDPGGKSMKDKTDGN